jgi:DNA-binding NtrC family response regulator
LQESAAFLSPDLLITNVFLPGSTGHDAMRVIKERCPGLRVLMISGLPDDQTIQSWLAEEGFDAFPKPFAPKDLVSKVQHVLNS